MGHAFLSSGWIEEVKRLRREVDLDIPEAIRDLKINFVVTGGPEGDVEMHIHGGDFVTGLAGDAPTKLTLPYDVARKLVVDRDGAAAMQAFMSGQVQVEGDLTKLMAMQAGGGPDPAQLEFQERIRAITE